MPSQDDREIVSSLRSLSRIDPPAESTRRMERSLDQRLRRPRRMRIAVIALAAMLLIAIGITMVIVMSSPTADAAENLRKVAQINESFKGWVHIGSDDPKKTGGINYNTTDYSTANVYSGGHAIFIDKSTRRELEYDPKSNTIYISNILPEELNESFEDASRRMAIGVNIQTLMDHWKAENPQGDFKVKQSTDGKYERYDIEFAPINKQTYWFDSKTKLLAKMEAKIGDRDWTNYYRYNDPVVHEIYDVGVPHDAKIVDNRPAGELKEVLDRLDREIERGMGDGVALLTRQIFRNDESPGGVGQLELYGQSGQTWAWYRYNVGSWKIGEISGMASFGPPIDTPRGWPAIAEVQPLLSDLPNRIASLAFAWDGNKGTRIEEWAIDENKLGPQVEDEVWLNSVARHYFGFPGQFSFGSHVLLFYQPTTSGQLLRDDAHRGMIGIDVSADDAGNAKIYKILWIDPSRDDVPIEYTAKRIGPDDHVDSIETIRYSAWQQTADHHWYPRQWERETSWNEIRENCYLLIDEKARLDSKWFTDPMKHFGPATMPAEPARPTTSATQRSSASTPAE